MKTSELFEQRKTEIVDATLEMICNAVCGHKGMFTPNLAFYVESFEAESITVKCYSFTGNEQTGENTFYIIPAVEVQEYRNDEPENIDKYSFEKIVMDAIDRHIYILEDLNE